MCKIDGINTPPGVYRSLVTKPNGARALCLGGINTFKTGVQQKVLSRKEVAAQHKSNR